MLAADASRRAGARMLMRAGLKRRDRSPIDSLIADTVPSRWQSSLGECRSFHLAGTGSGAWNFASIRLR
jgi:hypothetical protein